MDPDANLKEQRELAAKIIRGTDESDDRLLSEKMDEFVTDADRLAELVQALDEWLTKGGSLPKGWIYGKS